MKKSLLLTLAVILLLSSITGCGSTQTEQETTNATSNMTTDIILLHFETEIEFSSFWAKHEMPAYVLPLHRLRSLGTFDSYTTSPLHYHSLNLVNVYRFYDANGYKIDLEITPNEPEKFAKYTLWEAPETPPDLNNMRASPVEKLGGNTYEYNDIKYCYVHGRLARVYWECNNLLFNISIYPYGEYDVTEETFVSKLLDATTARAAVDELMASCFPED